MTQTGGMITAVAHCEWCAHPWRAAVLFVARQERGPLRVAAALRWHRADIIRTMQEARQRGCLSRPKCLFCNANVDYAGTACRAWACKERFERANAARRKAWLASGTREPWRRPEPTLPPLPLPPPPVGFRPSRSALPEKKARRETSEVAPGPILSLVPAHRWTCPPPCSPPIGSLVLHTPSRSAA